jgi:hypothetical protein
MRYSPLPCTLYKEDEWCTAMYGILVSVDSALSLWL